jgi:type I restriction enzyme S subunit
MNYLRVPREVSFSEVSSRDASWSPSMFRRIVIPNADVRRVGHLLASWCNGTEVGSISYVDKSPFRFIRTKALQDHSLLTQTKGDSIIPIVPKAFATAIQGHSERIVRDGDILYARGGSVGEVAFAYSCGQAVMSGHVLKILFKEDPFYCFAFMKHPVCKLQQASKIKGAIRALDNFNINTLLDCLIPFPNQGDAAPVIRYVSVLMQAIVEKEKVIRERHHSIIAVIEKELSTNRLGREFHYAFPMISEIDECSRFDSGLYCMGFRRLKHLVDDYKHGSTCLSKMGVKTRRGPNLAVSVIGKSLYSQEPKPAWYQLIRPVNISEYGTLEKQEWLGSPKKLPLVGQGDLIMGCEGFEKGRTIVMVDTIDRCTTNFHGTAIYWPKAELWQIVFVRCFLSFLREHGVVDWVGVGGSGGHMSPDYFDYLPIPKFPEDKQKDISLLYHHASPPPRVKPTLDTFVDWHRSWNTRLGIWELDREMKALQRTLTEVQEKIIEGAAVNVPLNGA